MKLLIPTGKQEIFDFYKMQLLEDGFPGRVPVGSGTGIVEPHPLYGVYLIRMSLDEYKVGYNREFREQAVRAGYSAIRRMCKKKDALVFIYPGISSFNHLGRDYYSALTQAKYLSAFWMLYLETGDQLFEKASYQVLKSLTIPIDEGGVCHYQAEGISFEEAPFDFPTFILNGWISVLENLYKFIKKSKSKEAKKIFLQSVELLKTLLPLYDMPKFKNSRYALAGTVPFRLTLPNDSFVESANLVTPSKRKIAFEFKKPHKWGVHLSDRTGIINGNLVFSLDVDDSRYNILELKVISKKEDKLFFEVPTISYDVLRGAKFGEYRPQNTKDISVGENLIKLKLKNKRFEMSCYPTNFKKKIAGVNYNAYHYMHIKGLTNLYEYTKSPVFLKYAKKWQGYTHMWSEMSVYNKSNISLNSYF